MGFEKILGDFQNIFIKKASDVLPMNLLRYLVLKCGRIVLYTIHCFSKLSIGVTRKQLSEKIVILRYKNRVILY